MTINLINTTSDKRRINKDLSHVEVEYLQCELKDDTSILNPIFILRAPINDNIQFNYVECELLHRYYFVEDVICRKGAIYEIHCHVDVLQTYKDDILDHNAFIIRQEEKFYNDKNSNGIFFDTKYPIRSDVTVECIELGQVANSYNYYLTVNGGLN